MRSLRWLSHHTLLFLDIFRSSGASPSRLLVTIVLLDRPSVRERPRTIGPPGTKRETAP